MRTSPETGFDETYVCAMSVPPERAKLVEMKCVRVLRLSIFIGETRTEQEQKVLHQDELVMSILQKAVRQHTLCGKCFAGRTSFQVV